MPVNADQFAVTPYTSTVPLAQIPPDAIEGQTRPAQPLQGQFGGGRGTPALAIGDSLLKGFMLGHQQKEQKKAAQAQATINAVDAASEAAYSEYQTALTSAGGKQDDPKAQAAYQAYITAFQAGKQAKAQFVIPEKTQKGKKAAGDTATGPDSKKKPASAGFNNIKDFFEANPHIVPQIALMTMQPKPAGLSPEGQQSVQNLESQKIANQKNQVQQQNEQTYQNGFSTYAHLGPDEIAALPPDAKKGYESWQNARAAITPLKYTGTTRLYDLGNGKTSWLYPEEASQYYPNATPVNTAGVTKPGSAGFYLQTWARDHGKDVGSLTAEEINQALSEQRAAVTPQTSTTSTSSTTPQGDRTTTTTRKAAPGGIGKPPTAGTSPAAQGVPQTAPKGSTQFTVGTKPQGMVEEGNLPVWTRPTVQNGDGTHSSEYSVSFQDDKGQEVLVPTVVDGKFLTPDGKKPKQGSPEEKAMFKAAWQHYLDTGQNLGKFKNSKDADAYANTLHNRGSAKTASGGGISRPPTAGQSRGIAPPPGGKQTATTASVTRQAVTKQQEGYRKAETAYTKALADADKAFAAAQKESIKDSDPSILATAQAAKDRAYARAKLDLLDAKDSVAKEYDAAVKSIGGTPGSQQPKVQYYKGYPYVQDPQSGEWKLQQSGQ